MSIRTPAADASTNAFMQAVATRRSIYALDNTSPVSDDGIEHLLKETMLHVPSAFNSQSTRVVLLLKQEHEKFWDMVKEQLRASAPDEEAVKKNDARLDGFRAGYGTIMFYEDQETIQASQKRSPAYAQLFVEWSDHTSAMHQFVLWTALETEGFGANLQHYQMDIKVETRAREMFDLPAEWKLKAQLVFGGRKETAPPPEKEKMPIEKTVRVFGRL